MTVGNDLTGPAGPDNGGVDPEALAHQLAEARARDAARPAGIIAEAVVWTASSQHDAGTLNGLTPHGVHQSKEPSLERLRDGLQRLARATGMVEGGRVPEGVAERVPAMRGRWVAYAEVRGVGTGALGVMLGDGMTKGCPHDGKLVPRRSRGGFICLMCGGTVLSETPLRVMPSDDGGPPGRQHRVDGDGG